ncbi:hypothetical protein GCM10027446_04220 [Angustibacter peucedani]
MLVVVVAEAVAIALLALLVLGLLRSHALILRALHELGAGLDLEKDGATAGASSSRPGPVSVDIESGVQPNTRPETAAAPAVAGTTLDGEEVSIPVAGAGRRTLVAFLSSGCSVCQTFWSEFATGRVDVPGQGRLVVVTKGAEDESASRLRELAGGSLEVVQSSATWTEYGVPGSPYFVYVEDGVITGEGSSTTWPQVRDLMRQAVGDAAEARRAAGRSGPGTIGAVGPLAGGLPAPNDDLVDVARADRELLGAGISPGHPSLYADLSPTDAEPAPHQHPSEGHTHP